MIRLALACALTGAEVANLTWEMIDLDRRVIDFTRRKTGRIRRICPIPAGVVLPAKSLGLVFVPTKGGASYADCATTVTLLFREVMTAANIKTGEGRAFSGLRTSWFNLSQCDGYDLERSVIMGHTMQGVAWNNYFERIDLDRLRHLSNLVWSKVSTSPTDAAALATPPASGETRSAGS